MEGMYGMSEGFVTYCCENCGAALSQPGRFCSKPECMKAKRRDWDKTHYQPRSHPCRHCGKILTGHPEWCKDNDECQKARRAHWQKEHHNRTRSDKTTWRLPKSQSTQVCLGYGKWAKCLHYIDNENRFYCSVCHHIVSHLEIGVDSRITEHWL